MSSCKQRAAHACSRADERVCSTVHSLSRSLPLTSAVITAHLSGPGLTVSNLTASQPCTKQAARCRNRGSRKWRRRRRGVPCTQNVKKKFGDRKRKKKTAVVPSRPPSVSAACVQVKPFQQEGYPLRSGEECALIIRECRSTPGPPSGTK